MFSSTRASRDDAVALTHAAYLLATGVWPLLHRRSFERLTGPKTDFWLVRTVGGLAAAIGLGLGASALTGRRALDARLLAVGSAIVFGAADVHAARTVSRVYLLDLLVQPVFARAWLRRPE
jgi:hypothetical protein